MKNKKDPYCTNQKKCNKSLASQMTKVVLSDDTRDFISEMTVMTSVGNGFP